MPIPMLIQWIKRKTCCHNRFDWHGTVPRGFRAMRDYGHIKDEILGTSLGWSLKPVVMRHSFCKCLRCGGEFWTKPGYLPRSWDDTPRDEKDWPLNPDGSRMAIYEGSQK